MSSPIFEFARRYADSGVSRFHMPGHKGQVLHGLEPCDLTEIRGADYLYEPEGIIARSEENAAELFGTARTLYSTEGSSLCIKTMLAIAHRCRKDHSRRMLVMAPRNVHKAFINACILLDIDVRWVYPAAGSRSLCSSGFTVEDMERTLASCPYIPDAVYVTSPDYLGNIADIPALSGFCKDNDIPLIVDNAHGAYLRFLDEDIHPITLGADMCCDSAHKTLPCYTGGALLHISKNAPAGYGECAKNVMSLFASTSPSYLIMESIDLCMDMIGKDYRQRLAECVSRTELCKQRLNSAGWKTVGGEKCKITIAAAECGMNGDELGDRMREAFIEPEYTDPQYTVLMTTPFNSEEDYTRLEKLMAEIPAGKGERAIPDILPEAVVSMPIRKAAFSPSREVDVEDAEGLVCGLTVTSCQPSVPAVVSGEVISADIIKILKRYGVLRVSVL